MNATALIPAPLHRWLLRVLQPWRLWLWGRLGREVEGIMVLGFAADGRLLLVRHSYHLPDQWLVPGGGRAAGEDILTAAAREIAEETGCTLHNARSLGQVRRRMPQGWTNRIEVVTGRITGTPRADGREIVAVALHAPDALPAATNGAVHAYLALWQASER
ncbi:NUDIX hydrolase [Novosphingobium sp. FSW06-99]|uniref:NUDIX hydrolase n=1 Tax=Novosphingobium sp. FSW06-99 TaxID=1739113 RepID=UPI00076C247C|nr:NUDIX domain-containing protein [Novosphingobium sp. FSW06-99]KUR76316.1 NUDIX hydrolase [Novosphingobium sp. FSW06-99]